MSRVGQYGMPDLTRTLPFVIINQIFTPRVELSALTVV